MGLWKLARKVRGMASFPRVILMGLKKLVHIIEGVKMIEDYQEEIEKLFKGTTEVQCDIPVKRCEMSGNYWRCYSIDTFPQCDIYRRWLQEKFERPNNLGL